MQNIKMASAPPVLAHSWSGRRWLQAFLTAFTNFDIIQVVPPSSALLMIENESQAGDCCEDQNVESDWCKALLCRRCGAVALLEREPKGFHHQEPLQHTSTVLLLVENIILLASPVVDSNWSMTTIGPTAPPNSWLKRKFLSEETDIIINATSPCNCHYVKTERNDQIERQGWLLAENYHHRWLQVVKHQHQ